MYSKIMVSVLVLAMYQTQGAERSRRASCFSSMFSCSSKQSDKFPVKANKSKKKTKKITQSDVADIVCAVPCQFFQDYDYEKISENMSDELAVKYAEGEESAPDENKKSDAQRMAHITISKIGIVREEWYRGIPERRRSTG